MKKCQRCSKPATLHITELKDGEAQALHLCENCAQDYLSTVDVGEPPESIGAMPHAGKLASAEFDESDDASCPNCGITWKEFRRLGRLGCPHDYVVFERELEPLLENIHGESEHVGKFPHRAPGGSQRQYELIRLRNQLREAVEAESYEQAASLRDQIRTLETEISDEAVEEK